MKELIALALVGIVLAFLFGLYVGHRLGVEWAERRQERLEDLDPPERSPGLPTNRSTPPSAVRPPRFRGGRFTDGDKRRDDR